jgi:hypothetical protein
MDPREEMLELERLERESGHSSELTRRGSRWGEEIRNAVIRPLKNRRPEAIEDAILFLEVSPRYFRSGYHKASIASKLKGSPLSDDQRRRLRDVILNALDSTRIGPEFREYARLAIVVFDAKFLDDVTARMQTDRSWVRARCAKVLTLCLQHRRI